MTALYDVELSGCDDSTKLLAIALTDDEAATLRRIEELSSEHGGGCKPVLSIGPAPQRPADAPCTHCWEPIPADEPPRRDRWGDWVHERCGGIR